MEKGSAIRAEQNETLTTTCAHCGKVIPAEIGYGCVFHANSATGFTVSLPLISHQGCH